MAGLFFCPIWRSHTAMDESLDRNLGTPLSIRISLSEFDDLVSELVGMRVSHSWRGHGSAMFLELGRLRKVPLRRKGEFGLKGQATAMIEWDWRVEGPHSVKFGSSSGNRRLNRGITSLKGTRINAISLVGSLPELRISFDDGRALQSCVMVEGQPEWCLFLKDRSWLCVRRGTIVHERG